MYNNIITSIYCRPFPCSSTILYSGLISYKLSHRWIGFVGLKMLLRMLLLLLFTIISFPPFRYCSYCYNVCNRNNSLIFGR